MDQQVPQPTPAPIGFSVGQRVRVVLDPPNGQPQVATVRVVQDDVPGKKIGLELDQLTDYCHSLDGLVEERTDAVRGIVVGKGWWTLPENLEATQ